MEKRLPFRFLSPTAWRSAASGVVVGALAYWLAAGAFGLGSFALFIFALVLLTLQFSEWRVMKYSLLALVVTLGILLSRSALPFPPVALAAAAGTLTLLLLVSAVPHRDPWRLAPRIFGIALTFLAALLLFAEPSFLTFMGFAVGTALLARDEVKAWSVLRVGEGRLIGAAVALIGSELAVFTGLLPLGSVRAAAFVTLSLLLAREGLGEAYQGNLRHELVFQGVAVFFALSVLLFASTPWSL